MSTATARFDFPPLSEVRRNFRVKWYRCPIDPAVLRKLMQRSNLQGAFQTLGHLGLFAVTGAATAYCFVRGLWVPFAIALWCHGTVGTFFRGLAVHELGHGTVFRTRWLNRFFLRVLSLLSWWNHHEYAMSHTYHHRYTLHPEGDREVLLPLDLGLTARSVAQMLTVNVDGLFRVVREARAHGDPALQPEGVRHPHQRVDQGAVRDRPGRGAPGGALGAGSPSPSTPHSWPSPRRPAPGGSPSS